MNNTISLITAIVLGIFAIMAGLMEFLERMGFPTPLQKQRDQKNKKIVMTTLEEAGLLPHKSELKQVGDLLLFKKRVPVSYAPQVLNELITKYTAPVNHVQIGLFEKTQINFDIDLITALSHPEDGKTLTRIMCSHIIDTMSHFSSSPLCFDRIAVSKYGNTALGLFVATELNKPWIFVDVRGGTISNDNVEGELNEGDEVILIHDVLASGKLMVACAQELAKKQVTVKHVFVLVERIDNKDDNLPVASKALQSCGLELHPVLQLSENELKSKYQKRTKPYRRESSDGRR